MQKRDIKTKMMPLLLSAAIILADQITKGLIIKNVPVGTIYFSLFGDFFRIIHVTNLGAAFSLGNGLSSVWRFISLCIIPLAVLLVVLVIFFVTKELSQVQRWLIAGILGGGFGNLIDRFFRPDGVVDFIDIKFYGLFGLERWPTFNIADSAVLICEIALVISFIFSTSTKTDKTDSEKIN
ncbi:MAG: signal peptidase II [Spirochaetaceae bacterium]|nr:signal peptidase II [Spirochaetaceae bacterium]